MSRAEDEPPIEGHRLTTWTVLPGGDDVRLDLVTADGRECGLVLPFDMLSSLLMTLPRMLQAALAERSSDTSLRVAQPLDRWRVEQVQGTSDLVLRLATPDGFEVSFAAHGTTADRLGAALMMAARLTEAKNTRNIH